MWKSELWKTGEVQKHLMEVEIVFMDNIKSNVICVLVILYSFAKPGRNGAKHPLIPFKWTKNPFLRPERLQKSVWVMPLQNPL